MPKPGQRREVMTREKGARMAERVVAASPRTGPNHQPLRARPPRRAKVRARVSQKYFAETFMAPVGYAPTIKIAYLSIRDSRLRELCAARAVSSPGHHRLRSRNLAVL